MKYYKKLFYCLFVLSIMFKISFAQFNSFRDIGLAYNKFMLDNGDNQKFDLISNYKVKGTPYLFGENMGSVYTNDGRFSDKSIIRYNTYSQEVLIVVNDKNQFITKQKDEIDSFKLFASENSFYKEDLHFVRGNLIDKNNNNFLQIILAGKNASLYKAYYSVLGIVTTNYVQSDLRQYDLNFDYYYYSPNTNGLKKIKLNSSWLNNEFKLYDIGTVTRNNLTHNSEVTLKSIFTKINN